MLPLDGRIKSQDGNIQLRSATGPTVILAAFGDLAFHGPLLHSLSPATPSGVFNSVRDRLGKADLAIGNLESVLVRQPTTPKDEKARLISDLGFIQELEKAGFHVLTLANNHILDAGVEGLQQCLEGIASSGMQATGAGMTEAQARIPASHQTDLLGFKIFAYSYGAGQIAGKNQPGCNEALLKKILKDISEFCRQSDMPVVCLHMDAEFQPTPAPDRVEMCRKLAESGVPLILCHHPHVLQGIEFHEGSLIAYSLGNYVFPILKYMTANSPECHLTCHLEIEIDRDGPVALRIEPAVIDSQGYPHPATPSEREEILGMIAERSRLLHDSGALKTRYLEMAQKYTRDIVKNIYWALGERDFKRMRLLISSLKISRTKRNWVLHYLKHKLFRG